MTTLEDYKNQLNEITNSYAVPKTITGVSQAELVKKELGQLQKKLRHLKSDVNDFIKNLRAEANEVITSSKPGTVSRLLLGKGKAKSINADAKRRMSSKRDDLLEPYEKLKAVIDKYLLAYDDIKLQMDRIIQEHKN